MGVFSISWNNHFYLQVSVCRESNDSKGTPVPVVGVSIRSPLNQDNAFVYVDKSFTSKIRRTALFCFYNSKLVRYNGRLYKSK